MKKIFLTLLFCSIVSRCFALTPMTDDNIKQAIDYGIASKQDKQTMSKFLTPWMVPERLLKNPYREKESVILYTPYLLTAIHARDKLEESRVPETADIKKAVQEYQGITLIGAKINAPSVLREGEYSALLMQNNKSIKPYASNFLSSEMIDAPDKTAPVKMKKTGDILRPEEPAPAPMRKIAVLELQFYFDSDQFNPNESYSIVISDKYCGERRFDVNPKAIR